MTFDLDGFTPIDVLGSGGFGTVHRAADDVHGREVAIKVLGRIDDDSARRRFDRERRAMGALSGHPNIGTVYTSGFTDSGQPFIVMEMIRGGSLADRVQSDGPLSAAEVIDLGATLADALQHAHDGGVLHLDLKPANILMSQFGRPKIVDFGIAAIVGDDSSTATIRATPSYADPDVLDGRAGTVRSDVYGLAATMFTLLTGLAPYGDGPSGVYQIVRRVAVDPVPAVDRSDVPPQLVEIIHTAMSKDPQARPESMAAFATQLRSCPPDAEPAGDHGESGPPTLLPPSFGEVRAGSHQGLPVTPSSAEWDWSDPVTRPTAPGPTTPAGGHASDGGFASPTPAATPPATPPDQKPTAYVSGPVSGPTPSPLQSASVDGPSSAMITALAAVSTILVVLIVVLVIQRRSDPESSPEPIAVTVDSTDDTDSRPTAVSVPDGAVPGVVGLTRDDATAALEGVGYSVAIEPHCFDSVVRQVPTEATELAAGGQVEVFFDPCVVPDFIGLSLSDAVGIVDDDIVRGIRIAWDEHCDDTVLDQSIAAGTTVEPGTVVRLDLRSDCS